jgi:hypothetical protein
MLSVAQAVTRNAPTNPDQTGNFFIDSFVFVIGQRAMVQDRTLLDLPRLIEYGTQPLKNESIIFTVR